MNEMTIVIRLKDSTKSPLVAALEHIKEFVTDVVGQHVEEYNVTSEDDFWK